MVVDNRTPKPFGGVVYNHFAPNGAWAPSACTCGREVRPEEFAYAIHELTVPASTATAGNLALFAVSENHPFVVHGEGVALNLADIHTGSLPLHGELLALASVGGLDLDRRGVPSQHDLAAARAVLVDPETARGDGHLVPIMLHGARHLVPIYREQVIRANRVNVGGSGRRRDRFSRSGDLRLRLAAGSNQSQAHRHQAAEEDLVPDRRWLKI